MLETSNGKSEAGKKPVFEMGALAAYEHAAAKENKVDFGEGHSMSIKEVFVAGTSTQDGYSFKAIQLSRRGRNKKCMVFNICLKNGLAFLDALLQLKKENLNDQATFRTKSIGSGLFVELGEVKIPGTSYYKEYSFRGVIFKQVHDDNKKFFTFSINARHLYRMVLAVNELMIEEYKSDLDMLKMIQHTFNS